MTFLNQKGHSVQRTIDISKQPPNHIINTKLILEQDFTLLAKFPLVSFHTDTLSVLRVAIVIFSTKHLLGKTILGVATIIMSTFWGQQYWIIVIFFERCYNDNEGENEAFWGAANWQFSEMFWEISWEIFLGILGKYFEDYWQLPDNDHVRNNLAPRTPHIWKSQSKNSLHWSINIRNN